MKNKNLKKSKNKNKKLKKTQKNLQEMVKKNTSKNVLKNPKSQKSYFSKKNLKEINKQKNLCFSILHICKSTKAVQSNPILVKTLENSEKLSACFRFQGG